MKGNKQYFLFFLGVTLFLLFLVGVKEQGEGGFLFRVRAGMLEFSQKFRLGSSCEAAGNEKSPDLSPVSKRTVPSSFVLAFWDRDWKKLDALWGQREQTGTPPDAKEFCLYLNALWSQRRYGEVLALVVPGEGAHVVSIPAELEPYVRMLRLLGYERTGRLAEAQKEADTLSAASSNEALAYYVSYAQARLARTRKEEPQALEWFRKMNASAQGDAQLKQQALAEILMFKESTNEEVAEMLSLNASHREALARARAFPAPRLPQVDYALGMDCYRQKNYPQAVSFFLSASSKPSPYFDRALYYLGYSRFRARAYALACADWTRLALAGGTHAVRAVERLDGVHANGAIGAARTSWLRIAKERAGTPEASKALFLLAKRSAASERETFRKRLFEEYPDSPDALTARFEFGWIAWKEGRFADALAQLRVGASKNPPQAMARQEEALRAKLLYWEFRCLKQLGREEEAGQCSKRLLDEHPYSYYCFLAHAEHAYRFPQAEMPADLASKPDLLEEYGFVPYARIELARREDIPSMLRAARLALWAGEYAGAYSAAQSVLSKISQERRVTRIPRPLMECLYPKAFEPEVQNAAKKTGIAPGAIWAVMRQESAFNPTAVSSAGAYGLMQMMPATGRGESRKMKLPEDAWRADVSSHIGIATNHLAGLLARYRAFPLALAAYNAGGGNVQKWLAKDAAGGSVRDNAPEDLAAWIEEIPFPETENYVKMVMANRRIYEHFYGKK